MLGFEEAPGLHEIARGNSGGGRMKRLWMAAALIAAMAGAAKAETVMVKYHGPVDLSRFECNEITRSSFIRRLCYAPQQRYMILNLDGTYYHHCAIGAATVREFMSADSMGRYYRANIRSRGSVHGPYDCRDHPIPRM